VSAAFKARAGQRAFLRDTDAHRITGFVCRRQYGKTTFAGDYCLLHMIRGPGHTVIFGSVKLDLSREIIRKEAGSVQSSFAHIAAVAREAKLKLEMFDTEKARRLPLLQETTLLETSTVCSLVSVCHLFQQRPPKDLFLLKKHCFHCQSIRQLAWWLLFHHLQLVTSPLPVKQD
jgi:hypothetical protein